MASGQMATDANYPSSNGLQLETFHSVVGGNTPGDVFATLTIDKTPGTGATYQIQELISDVNGSQWVNTRNGSISGNGAAATGQITVRVGGQAVRVNAVNGTTPGTAGNTPVYYLDIHYVEEQKNHSLGFAQ